LKLIIGSILILSIVVIFLFALFPSEISVSRLVQINEPKETVRKKIRNLNDWKNWNELLLNSIKQNEKKYPEPGLTDSNAIRLGYLTIELQRADPDTLVTYWQHGNNSFKSNFILSSQSNDQVVMEWTLLFHIKWYPWDKLAGMFYDRQLGPVMEVSLMNLKKQLEN
jgi:hypothetical protein